LEDRGYTQEQASTLAPISGTVQTIGAMVGARLLLDVPVAQGVWQAAGDSLLKRIGVMAAVEAVGNSAIMGGQAMADPAIRAVGHAMDSAMPSVDWSQELSRFKGAAPETLAQLAMMVAIGTGVGTLSHPAYAAPTVHDPVMLAAIGVKPDDIAAMQKMDPDAATAFLHKNWAMLGEPDPAAIQQLNATHSTMAQSAGLAEINEQLTQMGDAARVRMRARITPTDRGTLNVTSADGRPLGEFGSPELAGEALQKDKAHQENGQTEAKFAMSTETSRIAKMQQLHDEGRD
jgi:hypothetical protein